ncbi:hypothetical protein HPB52_022500 [Rhipicephalus sanguineus]|uniref:Tick transposon n=1 Tax=Rhipicephalus sanguineus TaxID=34632 RepID=A0A9D4SQA5_RHISA|nr:hypothetical protein HPB52_022500 [Rhipicephalus sanguineus]
MCSCSHCQRRKNIPRKLDRQANDEHARYVDADEYQQNDLAAVIIEASTGATRMAASVKSISTEQAEEMAIALAITDPDCHSVLGETRQAVRNFAKGERALRAAKLQERKVRIKWFPAHASDASERNDNHNETAHAAMRTLTNRALATDRPTWFGAKHRMTDYNDIRKAYRLASKTIPLPHPRFSRAEAILLRQLQAASLPSPALMHRMYPKR